MVGAYAAERRFGRGTEEASCLYNGFIVSAGVTERGKRKWFKRCRESRTVLSSHCGEEAD